MTEFKFPCPLCGRLIQCDASYAGMQINCPACARAFVVPAMQGSGVPAVPPPAPARARPWRTILIAAAAVVLLAALITAGWLGYLRIPNFKTVPHLVGWWKLDDGSGTVARDSSHAFKGNDGTLVGDPKWVKGRKGGALQLEGNQYVSLGNILQGGFPEMTIACWVKHGTSQWQNIVERSSWDKSDGIGLMMDYNTNSVSFGHYGIVAATSKINVQDNQWHHVAGAMRQSGSDYIYSIYVDGKLDSTATNAMGLTATENGWAIGARYDGTWTYQGLVEDVRVYDRALSDSEIAAIYAEKE